MTRRERRCLYSRLAAETILWASEEGERRGEVWELAMDEQFVAEKRKGWVGGKKVVVLDAQHMKGSHHYEGTSGDFNLYINGVYIPDGSHPAWLAIGKFWKALHELCAWGGDFQDANHLSLKNPATGTA